MSQASENKTQKYTVIAILRLPPMERGKQGPPKTERFKLEKEKNKLKNHKKQNKMLQRKKAFCQKTSIYKHWLYMTFRNAAKMEKLIKQ